MPTGDLGAPAYRKIDFEVRPVPYWPWVPIPLAALLLPCGSVWSGAMLQAQLACGRTEQCRHAETS